MFHFCSAYQQSVKELAGYHRRRPNWGHCLFTHPRCLSFSPLLFGNCPMQTYIQLFVPIHAPFLPVCVNFYLSISSQRCNIYQHGLTSNEKRSRRSYQSLIDPTHTCNLSFFVRQRNFQNLKLYAKKCIIHDNNCLTPKQRKSILGTKIHIFYFQTINI